METLIQHTVKKELDSVSLTREQQCICDIIDLVKCDPSVLDDKRICNSVISELWEYVEHQCQSPMPSALELKPVHFTESFCDGFRGLLEVLLEHHKEGESRLVILFLLYEIELVKRQFHFTTLSYSTSQTKH
ncbi:hypothetical protein MTBPR1_100186 [Candidatus Terasakiella magnetica]|uniref:Uncharacterized protein n=1 Tax=Candidatus Terasakiella magnetica TaxID=1867952 RepID=A0A1C3RE59_9PROT|nr:hypothetical protein [Candidatus Terasakiella magnetica]SCA55545.1 hypothetical protein MTBPR1_100186 [Candidatus Terasakiella magnetica]